MMEKFPKRIAELLSDVDKDIASVERYLRFYNLTGDPETWVFVCPKISGVRRREIYEDILYTYAGSYFGLRDRWAEARLWNYRRGIEKIEHLRQQFPDEWITFGTPQDVGAIFRGDLTPEASLVDQILLQGVSKEPIHLDWPFSTYAIRRFLLARGRGDFVVSFDRVHAEQLAFISDWKSDKLDAQMREPEILYNAALASVFFGDWDLLDQYLDVYEQEKQSLKRPSKTALKRFFEGLDLWRRVRGEEPKKRIRMIPKITEKLLEFSARTFFNFDFKFKNGIPEHLRVGYLDERLLSKYELLPDLYYIMAMRIDLGEDSDAVRDYIRNFRPFALGFTFLHDKIEKLDDGLKPDPLPTFEEVIAERDQYCEAFDRTLQAIREKDER